MLLYFSAYKNNVEQYVYIFGFIVYNVPMATIGNIGFHKGSFIDA